MNIETLLDPRTGAFILSGQPGLGAVSLMREAAVASKTPVLFNANETGTEGLNFKGAQNPSIIVLQLHDPVALAECFHILRPGTVVFVERFDLMVRPTESAGILRYLLDEAKDHQLRLILNRHAHREDISKGVLQLISVKDLLSISSDPPT